MYCANCGQKNQDNDLFCRACGAPLEKPTDIPNPDSLKDGKNSSDSSSSGFSSPSFINQPTELINPDLSNSSQVNSSSNEFTSNQDNQFLHNSSFASGSSQPNSFDLEPDQPPPFVYDSPEHTSSESPSSQSGKKRKKIFFLSIGLASIFFIGVGTYLFFNWDNLPFVNSTSDSESSSKKSNSRIVYVGPEGSEESSQKETDFKISIHSSLETTSQHSVTLSPPIKVEEKDPYVGKYRTNYVMKVRAQPNYEGDRITRKEEGVVFEVIKSAAGPNDSIWGQLPEGGWICLKDADLVYATRLD